MEKRLVVAILLTVVFLFAYSTLVKPPEQPSDKEPASPVQTPPPVSIPRAEHRSIPDDVVLPGTPADDISVETDLYRVVFSPTGGRIKSFRLKNFAERWEPVESVDKEISGIAGRISKNTSEIVTIRTRMRSETDPERLDRLEEREYRLKEEVGFLERSSQILQCLRTQIIERQQNISLLEEELLSVQDPSSRAEIKNRLDIESGVELITPESSCFGAFPPSISFPSLNYDIDLILFKSDKDSLKVTNEANTLSFSAVLTDGVSIRKEYAFSNENYAIDLKFSVLNSTEKTIREPAMSIAYFPGVGLVESAPARGVITGIVSFIDGSVYTDKTAAGRSALAPGAPRIRTGRRSWTAIKGKYFAVALLPGFEYCVLSAEALPGGGQKISVQHPEITIAPGDAFSTNVKLYMGPQDVQELSKADATLTSIIDYGFWSPVAKVIDYLLRVFKGVFHNFGVAIIMLSLTVKIAFYPLTHKSFIAMKKMQDDMKAIQPKLNELKKKYGNNQQKLNKATMELYKKEGVNPMSGCKGGCFPMLLQMPVFFALYAVLNTSIDLRGANFMGWITDLSMPDPLRILPVLMGVSMFWQQKQTGGGAAGPQQEQAKMMQWMMPVMLTFIFFGLPAGIVLYWFSFNIFTSLQQMLIKKHGS